MDHEQHHLKVTEKPFKRYQSMAAIVLMAMMALPAFAWQQKENDASERAAETAPASPQDQLAKELEKYPGLKDELFVLLAKIREAVELPPARHESRLLPLMPESTMLYAAVPNYGNALHQALAAFQQELKESAVLRDWWRHSPASSGSPTVEQTLEKLYQISQYLGDEIALSASIKGKDESVMFVAQVRKPGIKPVLEDFARMTGGKSGPGFLVVSQQQLATLKAGQGKPVVLVRPDLLVISPDGKGLRAFNRGLSQHGKFAATPFGQRLAQSYQEGTGILAAANLQQLLADVPVSGPDAQEFQKSGFADLKYLIWERKDVPGAAASQMELAFNGPRRGVASWLASPARLSGLDFVSPEASVAMALILKAPDQILGDIDAISGGKALAGLNMMRQQFNIDVQKDLLARLTGEIVLEMEGFPIPLPGAAKAMADPAPPQWKVILGLKDAEGLQQTIGRLADALGAMSPDGKGLLKRHEREGFAYYTVTIPTSREATEINYAIADGYLLVAPKADTLMDAMRFHQEGGSLARTSSFQGALPPGRSADASALVYQNLGPLLEIFLQRISPELARMAGNSGEKTPPSASVVYAEESSIRQFSGSSGFDAGAVMIVSAIAIPNLMRSRMAAKDALAVQTLHNLVVQESLYSTTYPERGYAPDLATLGQGRDGHCPDSASEKGACLVEGAISGPDCTAGNWCVQDSTRFAISAVCDAQKCDDFVVVATPGNPNAGTASFCVTSDAVVRRKAGPPLAEPVSVQECVNWEPL